MVPVQESVAVSLSADERELYSMDACRLRQPIWHVWWHWNFVYKSLDLSVSLDQVNANWLATSWQEGVSTSSQTREKDRNQLVESLILNRIRWYVRFGITNCNTHRLHLLDVYRFADLVVNDYLIDRSLLLKVSHGQKIPSERSINLKHTCRKGFQNDNQIWCEECRGSGGFDDQGIVLVRTNITNFTDLLQRRWDSSLTARRFRVNVRKQ